MLSIPGPIKKVFDTFPLVTHAPVQNTTPENSKKIEGHKYYFEGNTSSTYFTLAVHNVIHIPGKNGSTRAVPSDPVSLGHALILSHKNNLKLPTSVSQSQDKLAQNSLLKVSFHASPDNQLPILIEDSKEIRNIRTSDAINQGVARTNFVDNDPELSLVNDLIDSKLFDLWVLSLLSEDLDESTLSKIFGLEKEQVSTLTLIDLYQEIPNWNSFKTRHPQLFEKDHESIKSFGNSKRKIVSYYKVQLREFTSTFDLLIDLVSANKPSLQIELIQLKLVGYVVILDTLLGDTEVGTIVRKRPEFVKECYGILEKY